MMSKIPTSNVSAKEIASMLSAGRENRKASRCCAECKLVIYDREKLKLRATLGVKICDTCWAKKRPKDGLSPTHKPVAPVTLSVKKSIVKTPEAPSLSVKKSLVKVPEASSTVKKCLVKLFDVSRYPASHPFRKGFLSPRSLKRKFNHSFAADNSLEPPAQRKRLSKCDSSTLTASQSVHKVDKEITNNLSPVSNTSGKRSRNVHSASEIKKLSLEIDVAANIESNVSTAEGKFHVENSARAKKMDKVRTSQLKSHNQRNSDSRSTRRNSLNTENASKISYLKSGKNSETPSELKITRRSTTNVGPLPDTKCSLESEPDSKHVAEKKTLPRHKNDASSAEKIRTSLIRDEIAETKTSRRSGRNIGTPLHLSQPERPHTGIPSDVASQIIALKPETSLEVPRGSDKNTKVPTEMKASRMSPEIKLTRISNNTKISTKLNNSKTNINSTEMSDLRTSRSSKNIETSIKGQRSNINSEMPRTSRRSGVNNEIPTRPSRRSSVNSEIPTRPSRRSSVNSEIQTRTSRSSLNSEGPTRTSRRSSVNSEIPTRTSQRSSANSKILTRTSRRSSVNSDIPTRTSRRSNLSTEKPKRTSRRSSSNTEMPNSTSRRSSSNTEMPNSTSRRSSSNTDMPNSTSRRSSSNTDMPNSTSRRSSLNTEFKNKTSRRSSPSAEITSRTSEKNSFNSEVPPKLRATKRSIVPETTASGKKTVVVLESRPSKRRTASAALSEKQGSRITSVKTELRLGNRAVRKNNLTIEPGHVEIGKRNNKLLSSVGKSASLLPRPKEIGEKIPTKHTERKSSKNMNVVPTTGNANKRKQIPLEGRVKRIKTVVTSHRLNTLAKFNKPVLKTAGIKNLPARSAVKNQIRKSGKGPPIITKSNKPTMSKVHSKISKIVAQASNVGSNSSARLTLKGKSNLPRKRKLSDSNNANILKKPKQAGDVLVGKLFTELENKYKCITCNKTFPTLVEERLHELSHMQRHPMLVLHKCDSPQGVLSLIREDDFHSLNICSSDSEMPKDTLNEVNISSDEIYNEIDTDISVAVTEICNGKVEDTNCSSENNEFNQKSSENISVKSQIISEIDEGAEKEIKKTGKVLDKMTENNEGHMTEEDADQITKDGKDSNLEQSEFLVHIESTEQSADSAKKLKSSKEIASLLEEIFGESSEEDLMSAAGIKKGKGDTLAVRATDSPMEKQNCAVTSSQQTSIAHNSKAVTSATHLSTSVLFSGDKNRETRCPEDVLRELDCEDETVDGDQSTNLETQHEETSIITSDNSIDLNDHLNIENEKVLKDETQNTVTEGDKINSEKDITCKRIDETSEQQEDQQVCATSSVVEEKTILTEEEESNVECATELSVIEDNMAKENTTPVDSNLKTDAVAENNSNIPAQISLDKSDIDSSTNNTISKNSSLSDTCGRPKLSQNEEQCVKDSICQEFDFKSISNEQVAGDKSEDVSTGIFDNEMSSDVLLIPNSDCDRYVELKEDINSTDSADIEIYTSENSLTEESFNKTVKDNEYVLPRKTDDVNSNNAQKSESQVNNSREVLRKATNEGQMSSNGKVLIESTGIVENSENVHTDDKADSMGETMCIPLGDTGKDVVVIDATEDDVQVTEIYEGEDYESVCSTSETSSKEINDVNIEIQDSDAKATFVEVAQNEYSTLSETHNIAGSDNISQPNAAAKISDKNNFLDTSLVETSVGGELKATTTAVKLKLLNAGSGEEASRQTKTESSCYAEDAICINKIEKLDDTVVLNSDCEVSISNASNKIIIGTIDTAVLDKSAPNKPHDADTSCAVDSKNKCEIDRPSNNSVSGHVSNEDDDNTRFTTCDNTNLTDEGDNVISPSERNMPTTDHVTDTSNAQDVSDFMVLTVPVANCEMKNEEEPSEKNVSSTSNSVGRNRKVTIINGSSGIITGATDYEAVEAVSMDRKSEAMPLNGMHEDIILEESCESTVNAGICQVIVEGGSNTQVVQDDAPADESREEIAADGSREEIAADGSREEIAADGSREEIASERSLEETASEGSLEEIAVEGGSENYIVEESCDEIIVEGNNEKVVEDSNEVITVDVSIEEIAVDEDSPEIFVEHHKITVARVVKDDHESSTPAGQKLEETTDHCKVREGEENCQTTASGEMGKDRSSGNSPVNGNSKEAFVEKTCEVNSEKGHTSITEEVFYDTTVDEESCDSTTVDDRCVVEAVDNNCSKVAEIDSSCEIENTNSSDKVEIVDVSSVVTSQEVMLVSLNDSRESEPLDSGDKVTTDTPFIAADEPCSNSEISSGVSECCPSLVGAETLTFNVRDSVSGVFEEEESVLEADVTHSSLHEGTVECGLETSIRKNTFGDSTVIQDPEINDDSGNSNATLKDNVCLSVVDHGDISGLEPISDEEFDFV